MKGKIKGKKLFYTKKKKKISEIFNKIIQKSGFGMRLFSIQYVQLS